MQLLVCVGRVMVADVCVRMCAPCPQYHMVTAHGNLGDHQFGAKPPSWPLMGKTLPYWLDEHSNVRRLLVLRSLTSQPTAIPPSLPPSFPTSLQAQVTLIGNPLLWWVSSAAIFIFILLTGFYLLRRKRHVLDLSQCELSVGVALITCLSHDVL